MTTSGGDEISVVGVFSPLLPPVGNYRLQYYKRLAVAASSFRHIWQ